MTSKYLHMNCWREPLRNEGSCKHFAVKKCDDGSVRCVDCDQAYGRILPASVWQVSAPEETPQDG